MQHWVEHPSRSGRLLLTWRAPESIELRMRWAVASVWETEGELRFRHLADEEFSALNGGKTRAQLKDAGFIAFPPLPAEIGTYVGDDVLRALMRRLPPATRSDYPRYLAHHHIPHPTSMTPLQLLGATGAELPSDRFSLIDPLDPAASHLDCVMEIQGFRHYALPVGVTLETPLRLQPEPDNKSDPMAIKFTIGGVPLGYVNRLQAHSVASFLGVRAVTAHIARLNGSPERPRAFAMVQVRPR